MKIVIRTDDVVCQARASRFPTPTFYVHALAPRIITYIHCACVMYMHMICEDTNGGLGRRAASPLHTASTQVVLSVKAFR